MLLCWLKNSMLPFSLEASWFWQLRDLCSSISRIHHYCLIALSSNYDFCRGAMLLCWLKSYVAVVFALRSQALTQTLTLCDVVLRGFSLRIWTSFWPLDISCMLVLVQLTVLGWARTPNELHDHTGIYNHHILQDSWHFLGILLMMALMMVSLLFAIVAGNFLSCTRGCEATEQKWGARPLNSSCEFKSI